MKLLVLLVALFAAAPLAAEELAVRTQREGETIVVFASVVVPADGAATWAVLADYGRYAEFVPDLHMSRIRGRDERGILVEQRGDARFLFFRYPVEATLAVVEVPQRSITSTAVAGSFREMWGRYELAPAVGGTLITYAGRVVPGDGTPAWLTTFVLKASVERHFGALAREIARRGELPRLVRQSSPTAN
jgi:ribosome-associated toxin RatA of RatAB toxin-antitoxin module